MATWLALRSPNQGSLCVQFHTGQADGGSLPPVLSAMAAGTPEDQDRPLGQFAVPSLLPQAAPLLSSQACFFCGVKQEGLKIKRTTLWVLSASSLRAQTGRGLPGAEWWPPAASAPGPYRSSLSRLCRELDSPKQEPGRVEPGMLDVGEQRPQGGQA